MIRSESEEKKCNFLFVYFTTIIFFFYFCIDIKVKKKVFFLNFTPDYFLSFFINIKNIKDSVFDVVY